MSAVVDEHPSSTPRVGLGGGFASGPTGREPGEGLELLRRLWFTLGALIIFRLGDCLPMPGLNLPSNPLEIIGPLSWLPGAAIDRLSIVALGIMPYVSAYIIVELVSQLVPRSGESAIVGPRNRRNLNQYARILAVAFAAVQAIGVAFGLQSTPGAVAAPGLLS